MKRLRLRLLALALGLALSTSAACSLVVDTDGLAGGDAGVVSPGPSDAGGDRPPSGGDASTGDGAPPVCPAGAVDPDLILWLPMDETSGDTLVDCAKKGHDGKPLESGGWSRVAGRSGGGIDLDGKDGCFDLGVAADLAFSSTAFTAAAWIKGRVFAQSNGQAVYVLSRHGGTNVGGRPPGWHLGTDLPPSAEIDVTGSMGSVEVQGGIAGDTFVHVAGVYDQGTLTLYVNGTKTGSKSAIGDIVNPPADTRASIGCGISESGHYFGGVVDDVRVYKRALDEAAIAELAK